MAEIFKGFLLLRLLGLLALLIVVGVVLGIWSLARGSDLVGIVLLAGAVAVTATTAWLVARRVRGRRDLRLPPAR